LLVFLSLTWLDASTARASCRDPDVAGGFFTLAYAAEPDALIEYFGHNFFQITSKGGTKIITDPLAPGMYPTPVVTPHAVTVGREHPNHNYVELARQSDHFARPGQLRRRVEQTQHDGPGRLDLHRSGLSTAVRQRPQGRRLRFRSRARLHRAPGRPEPQAHARTDQSFR